MPAAAGPKPSILVQLDTDPQPSVFDGVVAVDSGVDHLFRHGGVQPNVVRDLVYGALFTRGAADLQRTAIFVGGSNVSLGEAIMKEVTKTFFANFRVSVLFDANGCNTTAAAAVLAALEGAGGVLTGVPTAVLAGTGPVGQRIVRLLGRLGARVALGSRSLDRAQAALDTLSQATGGQYTPFSMEDEAALANGLAGVQIVINAGAAGVALLPEQVRRSLPDLKVAIDLNAVPPLGIEGVSATDKGVDRGGVRAWGALGIGGTKMKIHKKAIQELYTSNDKVLDAEEILELGRSLG
jgi:hypothetical protein